MFELVSMFLLQLFFHLFRTLATRSLIEKKVWSTVILSNIVAGFYLVTTYLGLEGVNDVIENNDWGLVIAFLLGGSLGVYLNFKIKIGDK